MDLRDLYQDIVLDHGRHPRNFRVLTDANHLAHGHNPLCGDKVTVFLRLEDDRIADISFDGKGCAISTASASLMTEILLGKTLAEASTLFGHFHDTVTKGDGADLPPDLVEDGERLLPLTGVKSYPARVKCATLAWHTLEAAVKGGGIAQPVKTE
ncbi:Fe-S cluster assembly sulfur transfer protein SufU [Niveispirillum irakense]|uniref:Fe-S cluster assembly sulfur transfer protein SufU n=1 Tax=Niveispirillum irakense TaxID=34011 RepID=UPI00041B8E5A|nr:SUF system NifU family Fe-S cluster assembly protein [Niveispirillum irakense]